ncbi:MAG: anaerobic ribonucleoside-triphosphate reductase activating protein [Planctomycetota bacterium]
MEIRGFIENSLLEWQGKLACVVFVPDCNLRCHFCHAAHLLTSSCLETIAEKQILSYMDRKSDWLDGAVITGGEPTLHEWELMDFIKKVRDINLDVMVETNGTRPKWVERLISRRGVSAISMDVKAPLTPRDYKNVTQREVEIDDIRESIRLIRESDIKHEFRITVVPGLIERNDVRRMVPDLEGAEKVAIQNFQPENCLDESLHDTLPYRPEEIETIASELEDAVGEVEVRGRDRGVIARSERKKCLKGLDGTYCHVALGAFLFAGAHPGYLTRKFSQTSAGNYSKSNLSNI